MKSYFVTFRSITFAQKGENVLRGAGIHCVLQRTPRWMEEQGCGYCLRLSADHIISALELLRQRQVVYRKVYLRMASGDMEEVQL